MPIYFGSNKIKEIYNGSVPIKEVYNGSNKVFGAGALIEYGEFTASYYTGTFQNTFFPNFETSQNLYNVALYAQPSSVYFDGALAYKFVNYFENSDFQIDIDFLGPTRYNCLYQGIVELGGIIFNKYNTSKVSGGLHNNYSLYIPEGFIVNKSVFLITDINGSGVVSRDSSFGYTTGGYKYSLKSRHTINLLTGEEQ